MIFEPALGKDVAALKKKIADVEAIAIRSATQLNADVLNCAKNLKVIGRAGIGVDNVDIAHASKLGIIVMNTPTGNMVTTAEHAIAMMCSLTRQIPQATASVKSGKWEKNRFMGAELYGKKLGVIGCGNIGKEVAKRAVGLYMEVIGFDPFLSEDKARELGIKKVSFENLLTQSDYITIHTPLNDKTKGLINKKSFEQMKKGVFVINCARGGIVDEADLAWALDQKIVAGAALDVFEEEPVDPKHALLKYDAVICTPHLGASTEEAQENVALDVAKQIGEFLTQGTIANALNSPSASPEVLEKLGPLIPLCEKIGHLHGQLCDELPKHVQINYYGDVIKHPTRILTSAVLKGLLTPVLSETKVNFVNAPILAQDRGLAVQESKFNAHTDYTNLVEVVLEYNKASCVLAGTVFGKNRERIVRFDNAYPEFRPDGVILIIQNKDEPGVVGRIGTYLGQNQVNIDSIQLGIDEATGLATAFYNLTGDIDKKVVEGLKKLQGLVSVRKVLL